MTEHQYTYDEDDWGFKKYITMSHITNHYEHWLDPTRSNSLHVSVRVTMRLDDPESMSLLRSIYGLAPSPWVPSRVFAIPPAFQVGCSVGCRPCDAVTMTGCDRRQLLSRVSNRDRRREHRAVRSTREYIGTFSGAQAAHELSRRGRTCSSCGMVCRRQTQEKACASWCSRTTSCSSTPR